VIERVSAEFGRWPLVIAHMGGLTVKRGILEMYPMNRNGPAIKKADMGQIGAAIRTDYAASRYVQVEDRYVFQIGTLRLSCLASESAVDRIAARYETTRPIRFPSCRSNRVPPPGQQRFRQSKLPVDIVDEGQEATR
jgi:hypothetical protein